MRRDLHARNMLTREAGIRRESGELRYEREEYNRGPGPGFLRILRNVGGGIRLPRRGR